MISNQESRGERNIEGGRKLEEADQLTSEMLQSSLQTHEGKTLGAAPPQL